MAPQSKQYGDVKAVANALCCHRSTVWRMVKRGQLPHPVKIGNLTRWEMSTLVASASAEAEDEALSEAATLPAPTGDPK